MIGIVGTLEIRSMTAPASRWSAVILSVDVTLGACGVDMRTGQREIRLIMIKARRRPTRRGVALGAGLRILALDMVRVQGGLVIVLMA